MYPRGPTIPLDREAGGHGQVALERAPPPDEVQNGFYYKVPAATPRRRASHQVRSTPLLTRFDVTYKFRPYLRWQPR